MNDKEQKRLKVLNLVISDKMSKQQAADVLDLSLRHLKRLVAAYRRGGAAALAHGNRGRKPGHALKEELKTRLIQLARSRYTGFNFSHFTDLLEEREGIKISRSSVCRILLGDGLRSPRKRKAPRHRSRRERYPQEGMLLQIDGSPHDWLEGRSPELCLMGAIDDATGKVLYGHFQEHEDSRGYFYMLREITRKFGVPLALYHDRHGIFQVNSAKPSIEEQLAGKMPVTQFERLMNELGITSISANSPQAKGRVERLWNTFQDRLTSELRLVGAKNAEEANLVLKDFLIRFNRKFAVKPAESGLAFRKLWEGFKTEEHFCYKHRRTVGVDNVVQFGPQRLQILSSAYRTSYARCKVEVYEGLDGSLAIYFEGKSLPFKNAPLETSRLRKIESPKPSAERVCARPAPDHPWRGKYRTFVDK